MANWGETFCGGTLPSEARMWVKLATRRLFNLFYQTLCPRGRYVLFGNYQNQLPLWYNVSTHPSRLVSPGFESRRGRFYNAQHVFSVFFA